MPVANHVHEAMTRASWIRKMFERGAEMKQKHGADNVFDFTLGNPVLEPPAEFYEALAGLARRRDEGLHRYMANAGYPHVRAAIAKKLDRQGTYPGICGNQVVMCVGAAGGMNVVLKTVVNIGDEVVVFAPFFVEYQFYISNHAGVPVVAETDDSFDIDIDALAAVLTPKTKAVIINTPNNPTGRLYPRQSLEALAALLGERERAYGHPIYLVADEPYRELVYITDPPPSPVFFHDNSFLVYSWSKALSIPGDRIGFVAVNPRADDPVALSDGLTFANRTLGFVNAPASMQLIVEKILDVTVDIAWYRQRRDRLLDGLRDMGFDVVTPEGTFYIFPRSPDPDDVAFVNKAMEARVLLVPGSGFGRQGFFRISYSVDDRTIDGGLEALAHGMSGA